MIRCIRPPRQLHQRTVKDEVLFHRHRQDVVTEPDHLADINVKTFDLVPESAGFLGLWLERKHFRLNGLKVLVLRVHASVKHGGFEQEHHLSVHFVFVVVQESVKL